MDDVDILFGMPTNQMNKCFECGYECDRDLNAALNLCSLAVSSTVTACREDVRHTARMQPQRSKNQILSVGSDR